MAGHTIVLTGQRARRDAHELIERSPPYAVVNFQEAKRTNEQNALMWTLLGYISRAKPQGRVYAPEIWKSLFMASCGHQARWEPALDGNGVVAVGYRSSRLRKAEMGDLIECIYAYAAEHGVEFPAPQQSTEAA